MSCSKECYEPLAKFYGHGECSTCPGQDSGPSKNDKIYCVKCKDWHSRDKWLHKPDRTVIDNFI